MLVHFEFDQTFSPHAVSAGEHRFWNSRSFPILSSCRLGQDYFDIGLAAHLTRRALAFISSTFSFKRRSSALFFFGAAPVRKETLAQVPKRHFYQAQNYMGGSLTNLVFLREKIPSFAKMRRLPSVVFLFDPRGATALIVECYRLAIPLVSFCDSRVDPLTVTYPIPAASDYRPLVEFFFHLFLAAITLGSAKRRAQPLLPSFSFGRISRDYKQEKVRYRFVGRKPKSTKKGSRGSQYKKGGRSSVPHRASFGSSPRRRSVPKLLGCVPTC